MKKIKMKWFLISSSSVLIILVMIFNFYFNFTTFKDSYVNSLTSSYSIIGKETVTHIDYAIKFGKPLQNFYGMKRLLQVTNKKKADILESRVIDLEGNILYTTQESNKENKTIEKNLKEAIENSKDNVVIYNNNYHIFNDIKNKDTIGRLEIIVDGKTVEKKLYRYFILNIKYIILISFIAIVALYYILNILQLKKDDGNKYFLKMFITILIMSQISYGIINIFSFRNLYIENAKENSKIVQNIVSENINRLISSGVKYKELNGVDKWLKNIDTPLKEIENIYISDENNIIYSSTNKNDYSVVEKEYKNVLFLMKDSEEIRYKLNIVISKSYLNKKIFNMILDIVTLIITSILLSIELSILMIYLMNKKKSKKEKEKIDVSIIRTLAFTLIFGTDLTLSFIPIISKQLYQPSMLISENVATILPIQIEIVAVSICALITGYIIDKKGWKPVFLSGAVFLIIGLALSGLSKNLYMFILARTIVGIGYGLSWSSMSGFIGSLSKYEDKRKGFALLISGIYAGSNCGVVIGAMISERIGYFAVFFIAIALVTISFFIALYFIKNIVNNEKIQKSDIGLKEFLKDFDVISFFALITIPGMIVIMFLNYFTPVYGKVINISQSNIGRMFLLNGLIIIYLGPVLSEFLAKRISNKKIIILGSFLSALGLIIFSLKGNFIFLFLGIIIFSIGDSFGLTARSLYYIELKGSKLLGSGKALSILATIRKIGTLFGASVFSLIFVIGVKKGVFALGLIYILFIFIFNIVNKKITND